MSKSIAAWDYNAPDIANIWRVVVVEILATGFSDVPWLVLPIRLSLKPGESLQALKQELLTAPWVGRSDPDQIRLKVWVG